MPGSKKFVFVTDSHADGVHEILHDVHAVYWGFAEDIQVSLMRVSDSRDDELSVRFSSEGGCTGAAVSVTDLIRYVAQKHPLLLEKALAPKI